MAIVAYKVESKGNKKAFVLIESSGQGNAPRNASFASLKDISGNLTDLAEQMNPIAAVADTIRRALAKPGGPSAVEVEFGVELGAEAKVPLITSGSAKANFKVTITWDSASLKAAK